jgi:hypothetical protein
MLKEHAALKNSRHLTAGVSHNRYLSSHPPTPKFIIRWRRRSRTDVKFGIVKTIIFFLAGYSLSYMYVDENKTNQNKYHRIILCMPVASVQSYIIVIYQNAEIISNPTFPSALGSNLGNIRRIIDLYIMYETVWTNQIRPFSAKKNLKNILPTS